MTDLLTYNSLVNELTRESVLEKFSWVCMSYFCLGTEFRFFDLKENNGVIFLRKDSEYWHGKAVELAVKFLPSDSPIVKHFLLSYERHHSPGN